MRKWRKTWKHGELSERHGLKISSTKTEYLPSPTNDTESTVNSVDVELSTVTSFKYLGSIFTSEGGSQADVNNRIRIGWTKWKEVSGVMCDSKMPVKLKDSLQNNYQTSDEIRFRMLGRKEEGREQTKFSRNEDVEMGKRADYVGSHQKLRHQEGGGRKTC